MLVSSFSSDVQFVNNTHPLGRLRFGRPCLESKQATLESQVCAVVVYEADESYRCVGNEYYR